RKDRRLGTPQRPLPMTPSPGYKLPHRQQCKPTNRIPDSTEPRSARMHKYGILIRAVRRSSAKGKSANDATVLEKSETTLCKRSTRGIFRACSKLSNS